MSKRRGGLGSGLDALIPSVSSSDGAAREVAISTIQPNRSQPRTVFNQQALDELAASIREHGLIQPLIVTTRNNGGYELIAGERRLRAAQLAGLERVPIVVRETTSQHLLELALVENVQRADLNPLEEGRAYQALKEEFKFSDDEIARRVGKNRVTITNTRRLLNLTSIAQSALLEGVITAGHGRALLMLDQPEQQQVMLESIRSQDLSVRAAERLAALVADPQLDARAQSALLQGTITTSQAQALQRVSQHQLQREALEAILVNGLHVREAERLCELVAAGNSIEAALAQARPRTHQPISHEPVPVTGKHNDLAISPQQHPSLPEHGPSDSLSDEDEEIVRLFEQALRTDVALLRSGKKVRLTISFYNDEQLQSFFDLVANTQEN